jgi:hypothetical protein
VKNCNKLNEENRVDGPTLCRICDGKDLCNAAKEEEAVSKAGKSDNVLKA